MSLENNTTNLQEILASVNALPEAGGGGTVMANLNITCVESIEFLETAKTEQYEVGTLVSIDIASAIGQNFDTVDSVVVRSQGTSNSIPKLLYNNNSETTMPSSATSVKLVMPKDGADLTITYFASW